MKNKRNFGLTVGSMVIAVMISPFFAIAQDPGPCPDCPIDGGLVLLIAVGLLYGVKKYWDARKVGSG